MLQHPLQARHGAGLHIAEGLSERTESSPASALGRSTVPSGDRADDGESLEVMQKSSGYWEKRGTTED